jgi:hypothetical protein
MINNLRINPSQKNLKQEKAEHLMGRRKDFYATKHAPTR